ncbi:MAG: hypothetical protein PHV30_10650 [Candidatus Margulisbacteria bacterium]|nr:hypothetical protein [Candidatus Margulisiibacteriota bacterium]
MNRRHISILIILSFLLGTFSISAEHGADGNNEKLKNRVASETTQVRKASNTSFAAKEVMYGNKALGVVYYKNYVVIRLAFPAEYKSPFERAKHIAAELNENIYSLDDLAQVGMSVSENMFFLLIKNKEVFPIYIEDSTFYNLGPSKLIKSVIYNLQRVMEMAAYEEFVQNNTENTNEKGFAEINSSHKEEKKTIQGKEKAAGSPKKIKPKTKNNLIYIYIGLLALIVAGVITELKLSVFRKILGLNKNNGEEEISENEETSSEAKVEATREEAPAVVKTKQESVSISQEEIKTVLDENKKEQANYTQNVEQTVEPKPAESESVEISADELMAALGQEAQKASSTVKDPLTMLDEHKPELSGTNENMEISQDEMKIALGKQTVTQEVEIENVEISQDEILAALSEPAPEPEQVKVDQNEIEEMLKANNVKSETTIERKKKEIVELQKQMDVAEDMQKESEVASEQVVVEEEMDPDLKAELESILSNTAMAKKEKVVQIASLCIPREDIARYLNMDLKEVNLIMELYQ